MLSCFHINIQRYIFVGRHSVARVMDISNKIFVTRHIRRYKKWKDQDQLRSGGLLYQYPNIPHATKNKIHQSPILSFKSLQLPLNKFSKSFSCFQFVGLLFWPLGLFPTLWFLMNQTPWYPVPFLLGDTPFCILSIQNICLTFMPLLFKVLMNHYSKI